MEQLEQLIANDESQALAGLMHMEHSEWLKAVESLPDDDLLHLIRFFAVAENLPGWEAGERSPVIPLAKTLRRRGVRLEKSLLQVAAGGQREPFSPLRPPVNRLSRAAPTPTGIDYTGMYSPPLTSSPAPVTTFE